MAIIGPPDLPKVLKVDSNPLKLRALHALGWPNVNVEITEDQFEELLRVTGDFIATYFPKQERYAYFYTQPLQTEYDMPSDAYWIREVAWDPVVTRINDIFSAEMFLFCICADDAMVFTNNGLKFHDDLNDGDKLVTPYGYESFTKEFHDLEQQLIEVSYDGGVIRCTTNQPIKVNGFDKDDSLEGWENASELYPHHKLVGMDGLMPVKSIKTINEGPTVTIKNESGCFYACSEGKPILLH